MATYTAYASLTVYHMQASACKGNIIWSCFCFYLFSFFFVCCNGAYNSTHRCSNLCLAAMGVVLTADYPEWLWYSSWPFSSLLSRVCCLQFCSRDWSCIPFEVFCSQQSAHGRGLVEVFHTVGKGPTACCTVTVEANLAYFSCVLEWEYLRDTFILTLVKHSVIHRQCAHHRHENFAAVSA